MSQALVQALQNSALYDHPVDSFEVIETHISWVFLTGDYAYKIDYGGRYVDVRRLLVLRKGRVHAARAWLLLTASDLLHLGYYRIYFSRLIPKIRAVTGRRPRPLWRIWIRSRV